MVTLTINTSQIQNGRTAKPSDVTTPLIQLKSYQENMLNGLLAFDGLLVGAGSKDASAIFQINSTTQGFAPPRMTEAQRDAIASPLIGAIIYNTTTSAYNIYTGTWEELAIGATGAVEASCRLTKSGTQAITTSTYTAVTWDVEDYDTDTMHDTVTNNSRITFTTAGKYLLTSTIKFTAATAGTVYIEFYLNGTTIIAAQTGRAPTLAPYLSLSCLYNFSASDYVEVRVYHSTGSDRSVDNVTSYFAASRQLD